VNEATQGEVHCTVASDFFSELKKLIYLPCCTYIQTSKKLLPEFPRLCILYNQILETF